MRRRGASVIFVLAILLLFIFTGMLLFMFAFWEKTTAKHLALRAAAGYARTAIQRAIWELDHDDRAYDCLEDAWWTAFAGVDVDVDGDGERDARWFLVGHSDGAVVGRWAVTIVDESARVHLNASGTEHGGAHEGHATWEIALLPHVWGPAAAPAVAVWRSGSDGKPGVAGTDDNDNVAVLSSNRIDDDGDGLTDEEGEGIDEPQEFVASRPWGDDRPYLSRADAKLAPGVGPALWRAARPYLTVSSYDTNRDASGSLRVSVTTAPVAALREACLRLGYGEEEAARIAACIADYRDTDSVPTVLATSSGRVFGIERTPYLNEVDGNLPARISVEGEAVVVEEVGGHFIELFNPYDRPMNVGGWTISGVLTMPAAGGTGTSIVLPPGAVIPPRSYYTIGDSVKVLIRFVPRMPPVPVFLPTREPAGCDCYAPILFVCWGGLDGFGPYQLFVPLFWPFLGERPLVVRDASGNLIEETLFPRDTAATTVQKNDPRMMGRDAWFQGPTTPGFPNAVFAPWTGGEVDPVSGLLTWPSCFVVKDGPFATLGELSRLFRGQQWRTLDFWRSGSDSRLLDRLTTQDDPSASVPGRLNLNTASETTLLCLPLVDPARAAAIRSARPLRDIGEVLGTPAAAGPQGILSREMTRFGFDGVDNDGDGWIDVEQEKELAHHQSGDCAQRGF